MDDLDTPKKLKEWLRKMDYDGEIPTYLKPICNPSTAFIWEQLVNYVKPKTEITHIRNHLITNRLSRNNECDTDSVKHLIQDDSNYPIKEIEIWNKKRNLETKIRETYERIGELETEVDKSNQQNKVKYLALQNLQQKVSENQKFSHLLRKKSNEIEEEIVEAEDKLNLVCNLTPVEESKNKDVSELLNKCSKKLENLLQKKQPQNETLKSITPKSAMKHFISFSTNKNKLDDSLGLLNYVNVDDSELELTDDLLLLNDKNLSDMIECLLHKNNRMIVWNSLMDIKHLEKMKLLNLIVDEDKQLDCAVNNETKNEGVQKLYALHVDCELKSVKLSSINKKHQQNLSDLQQAIWKSLSNKNVSDLQMIQLKSCLQLHKKEVSLTVLIQFVQTVINSLEESTKNCKSLQLIRKEAQTLQKSITTELLSLEQKVDILTKTHSAMIQKRKETKMVVRKLNTFTSDLNWILPLGSNLISCEIATLFNFPLEYNRTIKLEGDRTFLRDLHINEIPYEDFNSNKLYMMSVLLQQPWSPSEFVILNMMESESKLNDINSLLYVNEIGNARNKYSVEELKKQQSNLFDSLDKLKLLNHSIINSKISQTCINVQESIRLWLEMPIRNFISPRTLVDGFEYSHYENIYNNHYSKL